MNLLIRSLNVYIQSVQSRKKVDGQLVMLGFDVPPLHLHPINVIVFNDPKKSNLVAGFVLRCFQHLSNPDLDTQQCTWRHNW